MCWSVEASAALAVVGLGATGWAAYKKEPAALYLGLGYSSLMELLQAFAYPVIDQCSLPSNQVITLLGYLHIAFQPLFINLIAMQFIPSDVRNKIQRPVYIVCFFSAIIMLLQLYPFEWAGQCKLGDILCAEQLCVVSGNWHIAWGVPVNGILNFIVVDTWFSFLGVIPSYHIAAFLLPLIYGSFRFTAYHIIVGPMLARLLSSNPNEVAAIWCLFSIAILLLVILGPLRKKMYVNSWWLWQIMRIQK